MKVAKTLIFTEFFGNYTKCTKEQKSTDTAQLLEEPLLAADGTVVLVVGAH